MTTNDHRPVLRGELVLVLAAFTMGKGVALVGKKIDKKAAFVSFLEH